ncbi:regulatory protein RecX [Aurantiacibacter zhengii]|uniref:Regulatory protein RecX n=1 Tax=Aurantiacibacter zhengii TaxID=2307003 RepID=A0A418NSA7_9SPHN|nr:regulatory protein RecX [Aurantiacibacter zhengii]RIV85938.1 RecX family transcriptional regulator [Aurantiacibacter zhengii]
MDGNSQDYKREPRRKRPLDATSIEEMALAYVARFATSAAKLERYLKRKLRERGWAGEDDGAEGPDIAAMVARYVEKGYVDDAVYARAKANDLLRRGYGERRVKQALGQAGIGEAVADDVAPAEHTARTAALHLARKRGFGPFGAEPLAREKREKQIAAMLRAGHTFDHVLAVLDAESARAAEQWAEEAREETGTWGP